MPNVKLENDYDRIENLGYITHLEKTVLTPLSPLHHGEIRGDIREDDALSHSSSLTPSIDKSSLHGSEDDTESDESTYDNNSGPFLASFLAHGKKTGRTISYKEHKEIMKALNDKWDCELDQHIRQSEQLLYEQAQAADHHQGILADRKMKEALDEAREKEKEALKMEAKLREEYRELKLQLEEEIRKRASLGATSSPPQPTSVVRVLSPSPSPSKASSAGLSGAREAIKRYCLTELSHALEKDLSDVVSPPSPHTKKTAVDNNSFRAELRVLVKQFKKSSEEKTRLALLEQENSIRDETNAKLQDCKETARVEMEKLINDHVATVNQLHLDAERDRALLTAEMQESFRETMSQCVQKRSSRCLKF